MEILAAGTGDHTDLAGAGTAVFGRVVGGENLDFLDGVRVGGADRGAIGAGADTDGAVKRDERVLRTAAVDRETTGIEAVAEASHRRTTANAGLQHREEERVAAVQREILNLLLFDGLADRGSFSVQLGDVRLNLDCFRDLTNREVDVDLERDGRLQFVAGLAECFKAGGFDSHRVVAGGDIGCGVEPGLVGRGLTFEPGAFVANNNLRIRNDATAGIFNNTRDGRVVRLCEQADHGC